MLVIKHELNNRTLKYMLPGIFLNKVMYSYTSSLEYCMPENFVQAGTFHTRYVNTHYYNTCSYSFFFNIILVFGVSKYLGKKFVGQKLGAHAPRNYPLLEFESADIFIIIN